MTFSFLKFAKRFASGVRLCCFCFFQLFPIENKVIFSNFSGKRYGDNTRYISERLHEIKPDCEIIWLQERGYFFEVPDYVKIVRNRTIASYYHMSTAKAWVDTHLKQNWMIKRRGTYFINTWHGGLGFKKIEGDVANPNCKREIKKCYHTSKMVDLFVSNSTWLSDIYRRAFKYDGEILECGFPRNDIFFGDTLPYVKKIRNYYMLDESTTIVLYAPTFRDVITKEAYGIDLRRVTKAVEKLYERPCKILVRLHPLMMKHSKEFFEYSEDILDVTGYPNVQELIIASDIMITDYSSTIFDFILMKKPGFIFATDLETYRGERGFYHDMDYYPFPVAYDNDGLEQNILEFNDTIYQIQLKEFVQKVGLRENGSAINVIVDKLIEHLK